MDVVQWTVVVVVVVERMTGSGAAFLWFGGGSLVRIRFVS